MGQNFKRKEINASATPKTLLRTGTNFKTVKLQNTNNDRAMVPKCMGQARKFGHFERSSQCP